MDVPKSTIIMPLKPVYPRYVDLFIRKWRLSIFRALEYETLREIRFQGRILDVGGGECVDYRKVFFSGSDVEYHSANIDPAVNPTYLPDVSGRMIVPAEHFDMVVSFNTLEHIYDLDGSLNTMIAALKPGGQLVLAVPFLFRRHGGPEDFHRKTDGFWVRKLHEMGLGHIEVRPLAWDLLTVGLSITELWALPKLPWQPVRRLRKALIPLYGLIYASIRLRGCGPRYPEELAEGIVPYALGYVIRARKGEHNAGG
jgi:SAM-dependent methyltransferase